MDRNFFVSYFLMIVLASTFLHALQNQRENVARNKQANQSSTIFYLDYSWDAALVLDGKVNFDKDCECCSCTNVNKLPWLEVDLKSIYSIGRIDVFGRHDIANQLRGFEVFTREIHVYHDTQNSTRVYINNVTETEYLDAKGHFKIAVGNVRMRYIRIRNMGIEQMSICEVEVYKACEDFQFEPDCVQCHCSESTCDKITGLCPSDCIPGWHGAACNISCEDGTYGVNCKEKCRCLNPKACDKVTGTCTDGYCMLGWKGDGCNKSSIVSFNKSVTMSSLWSSIWKAELAVDGDIRTSSVDCRCCTFTDVSTSPWFEINLGMPYRIVYIIVYGRTDINNALYSFKDMEIYDASHDSINKELPIFSSTENVFLLNITLNKPVTTQFITLKQSGEKQMVICELQLIEGECENGTFGRLCNTKCFCQGEPCDKETGVCPSGICLAGYHGATCSKECDDRHFGYECNEKCGFCFNNTACDKAQGSCTSCGPGYKGHLCVESCPDGTFGQNCSSHCGKCKGVGVCDYVTGYCPQGCETGHNGVLCNKSCINGRYGDGCAETCGQCASNATCNITNGHCDDSGCTNGFIQPLCQVKIGANSNDASSVNLPLGVTVGIPCCILVALVVLVVGVIFRRRMRQNPSKKDTESSGAVNTKEPMSENTVQHIPDEYSGASSKPEVTTFSEALEGTEYYGFAPRAEDIKIYQIVDYIHNGMTNQCKQFYEEFESLKKGLLFECKCATELENKMKNRYKEICAYDKNRVPLTPFDPDEGSYINASFIDGYEKVEKFIASQGPTKHMVDDFWRMIWQQQCSVIVMLTNVFELDVPKCLQYWPIDEPIAFRSIAVKLVTEENSMDYVIRNMEISRMNEETRLVKQYHFTSWPDKTIPDTAWTLVNFWRAVCEETKTMKHPVVVHCSAGIGRTGTYIALDSLYHQAVSEGCIRPLQIVEALRMQRANMVQTKEQYVYMHEAVSEALLFGTHFVKTDQFEQVYSHLLEKEKGKSKINLEIQFELLDLSIQDHETTENNDTPTRIEADFIATSVSSQEADSVYTNVNDTKNSKEHAETDSNMQMTCQLTYKDQQEFVVTTEPTYPEILQDFLDYVMSSNVTTIVRLQNGKIEHGDRKATDYQLKVSNEKIFENWTQEMLEIQNTEKDASISKNVTQFTFHGWVDKENTPNSIQSLLDFLSEVQVYHQQQNSPEELILVSESDARRFGLICVILNELTRMKTTNTVNIVHSVKKIRHLNRSCISNFEQYRLCYEAILYAIQQTEVYQNV